MKKTSYLTSLLLAASVCQAGGDQLLAAPTARPTASKTMTAAKGTKATKATKSVSTVADVVAAANTFYNLLSTTQKATVIATYNATNVIKWSNLPCGATCREGLQLADLSTAQVAAAMAVVQAATGTTAGDGFDESQQIRVADDNLGAVQSGYSNGIYFIAFVGTPSTTGTWQLQFGGHHLATNITYGNGNVTGATPKFEGVEPLTFTTANSNVLPTGTVCAPLANEASTMLAMLNGLTTAHKTTAKLTTTFSDVLLGPGQDGKFPSTKLGVKCSDLTAAEQALVIAAMRPWVQDADDATAAALLATYTSQLADTYISYAGTGLFTNNTDYARIDGPNVWIEFVCQTGVVYRNQIHYHSIWRDHARDYGGNFSGFVTVLGTREVAAASVFGVYPSPITVGNNLQVQLLAPATTATYTLRNLMGQTISTSTFQGSSVAVPTVGLAPGMYLMSVKTPTQVEVTSRVQIN